MHLGRLALLTVLLALPLTLRGQAIPTGSIGFGMEQGEVPRREVGANFNYIHANAPPGQCGCFSLIGGSGTFVFNLRPSLSAVADITAAHASHVNNTSQDITIFNFLFGPRYSYRTSSRFVPYGEVLLGSAKEDVNFQFVLNRRAFGLSAGGGVNTRLSRRVGLTIVQADYVYTSIPNGKSNTQNNTRISTGLSFLF